jgi:hypothetical protein
MLPVYLRRTAAVMRSWSFASALALIGCTLGTRCVSAQSQTFNSGSTGADGALNITAPGLTYFDPATIPNHHAGDTIFNFTTINIAQGSTLRLDSRNLPGPVYWLATGDVNIGGTLDLTGQNGHDATGNRVDRGFSAPGAGGFGGGSAVPAEPGAGPGGGSAGSSTHNGGGSGVFSGSQYLIPLVGGSGGGGAFYGSFPFACGGGAGGGAVLIASSTSIVVSGNINAFGGGLVGCSGIAGLGSGGAVRLIAGAITIAQGGTVRVVSAGTQSGFARLESFQLTLQGGVAGSYTTSMPLQVALPTTGPSFVKVTSVNGIAINANPFTFPDVTINTSSPVPVVMQGTNVPPGAIPTLYIVSETGPDQVITAPALEGTLQSSTSTVNITYPAGGSRGLVRVSWTQ